MAIWMNGLRVYTNPAVTDPHSSHRVFYSRRADGPYYLWRYEEGPGQWRVSRMQRSESTPKPLSLASWKVVPPALQAKLGEHYME
jgi:hypothetical protein